MNDLYLDAEWSQEEILERQQMAQDYSLRCYELRRDKCRRFGTFVQRMLAGSVILFLWVCILALLLGAL